MEGKGRSCFLMICFFSWSLVLCLAHKPDFKGKSDREGQIIETFSYISGRSMLADTDRLYLNFRGETPCLRCLSLHCLKARWSCCVCIPCQSAGFSACLF